MIHRIKWIHPYYYNIFTWTYVLYTHCVIIHYWFFLLAIGIGSFTWQEIYAKILLGRGIVGLLEPFAARVVSTMTLFNISKACIHFKCSPDPENMNWSVFLPLFSWARATHVAEERLYCADAVSMAGHHYISELCTFVYHCFSLQTFTWSSRRIVFLAG